MFLFSEFCRQNAAWEKASPVSGFDPAVMRLDRYGSYIAWLDHGERNSEYGWEIDHIVPQSRGGSDDFSNLQALHWKNNILKSDSIPHIGSLLSSLLAYDQNKTTEVAQADFLSAMLTPIETGGSDLIPHVGSLLSSMLAYDQDKRRDTPQADFLSAMLPPMG
jgi:hypothetical protein